jgi:hypothetical protein
MANFTINLARHSCDNTLIYPDNESRLYYDAGYSIPTQGIDYYDSSFGMNEDIVDSLIAGKNKGWVITKKEGFVNNSLLDRNYLPYYMFDNKGRPNKISNYRINLDESGVRKVHTTNSRLCVEIGAIDTTELDSMISDNNLSSLVPFVDNTRQEQQRFSVENRVFLDDGGGTGDKYNNNCMDTSTPELDYDFRFDIYQKTDDAIWTYDKAFLPYVIQEQDSSAEKLTYLFKMKVQCDLKIYDNPTTQWAVPAEDRRLEYTMWRRIDINATDCSNIHIVNTGNNGVGILDTELPTNIY